MYFEPDDDLFFGDKDDTDSFVSELESSDDEELDEILRGEEEAWRKYRVKGSRYTTPEEVIDAIADIQEEEAEEECKHEFTTTRLLQHVYLYWFETLLSEI